MTVSPSTRHGSHKGEDIREWSGAVNWPAQRQRPTGQALRAPKVSLFGKNLARVPVDCRFAACYSQVH
jgi:hypothetical protein